MTTAGVGGWDLALPTTQLVLPGNGTNAGSQTPGSGDTVLGGPLPASLTAAGYSGSGIIWYREGPSTGLNQYDYQFIVHGWVLQSGFRSSDGVLTGYYGTNPQGYGATFQTNEQYNPDGGRESLAVAALQIQNLTNTSAYNLLQYDPASNGILVLTGNASSVAGVQSYASQYRDNGSTGYDTANDTDYWQTQTIGGRTLNGVPNCTIQMDWRITYDRWVDYRIQLVFPASPAPTAGAVNLGAIMPVAIRSTGTPNALNVYGGWGGANLTANGIVRVQPSSGGVLWGTIPATAGQSYNGQVAYSLDKPTF